MKGSYIILQIKIELLKNFLDHVIKEAKKEIDDIIRKKEAGEYNEINDFGNALYYPLQREEIAARTIYYEINALFERELRTSALKPWKESEKFKGPKTLDFKKLTINSIRSLKMISDVPFKKILKLIENEYDIKIINLKGADTLFDIRDAVNAFKHKDSYIDFRKQEVDRIEIGKKIQAEVDKAYFGLVQAYEFIVDLWKNTEREPTPIFSTRH